MNWIPASNGGVPTGRSIFLDWISADGGVISYRIRYAKEYPMDRLRAANGAIYPAIDGYLT